MAATNSMRATRIKFAAIALAVFVTAQLSHHIVYAFMRLTVTENHGKPGTAT